MAHSNRWVLIVKIFKLIAAAIILLAIGMLITAIAMSFPAEAAPPLPLLLRVNCLLGVH